MGELLPLEALGPRIMICGPSNSGKSTLCVALASKLKAEPIHLDQLRHQPGTNWVERPDEEFLALHDEAIARDRWVMDGNYSRLMPQRIARATGIIFIYDSHWANFRRYLWRTLFQKQRAGALPGNRDSLKWQMIRWILFVQPKRIGRDQERARTAGLPLVEVPSMRELQRLYAVWDLQQ
jgi:adenylate kinase family enzyme